MDQAIVAVLLLGGWSGGLWLVRRRVRRLQLRPRLGLSIAAWVISAVVFYLALGLLGWPALPEGQWRLDYGAQTLYELQLVLAVCGSWLVVLYCWGEPAPVRIGLPSIRGQERRCLADIGFGLLLGPLALGTVLVVGLWGGWFSFGGFTPPGELLSSLLWGALLFALVGLVEEITTRGGLVAALSQVIGTPAAVIVSTLTFVALHVDNPGASPLALIGVGAAGLVLSLALLRTGALWLGIAFHASWDWSETSLYGFADSGLPPAGALQTLVDQPAPDWLTGGTFGPEASVPVLLALVGVGVVFVLYSRGRALERKLASSRN